MSEEDRYQQMLAAFLFGGESRTRARFAAAQPIQRQEPEIVVPAGGKANCEYVPAADRTAELGALQARELMEQRAATERIAAAVARQHGRDRRDLF